MPNKTKTQLKAELEEAKQELKELQNKTDAEIESRKAVEESLRAEVEELRLLARDSKRALREQLERKRPNPADKLEYLRRDSRPRSETPEDTADVGLRQEAGLILREVLQARDETLEAIDRTHWELDKMKRDMQQFMRGALESMVNELKAECQRGVSGGATTNPGEIATHLGGGSDRRKTTETNTPGTVQSSQESDNPEPTKPCIEKPMKLPPLLSFSGESREDVDALDRWLAKLEKHAELMCWSEHTKLLQFELHLAGRAKRTYELLSATARKTYKEATTALRQRLYPVESEALVSAQLMRCKQLNSESVDEFAQELEKLFERSYGRRHGMVKQVRPC